MRPITDIVIHCSATPNGDARFTMLDLDRMHRERGWRKIGYHFIVELDGKIVPGRPVEEVGAHVAGSNARSIGVCMIGTDRFTDAQWVALRELIFNLGERFQAAIVRGHRDYSPDLDGDDLIEEWEWFKTCPGFDVQAWRMSGMDPLWNPAHIFAAS